MTFHKFELITYLITFVMIFLSILLFGGPLNKSEVLVFYFCLLLFIVNYTIIILHQRKYKGKNFPYKPFKSKKKILERISLGLLAGLHYFFFIGNYSHKRYNTQAWYPETLECIFGNISQMIILILYLVIGINLYRVIGYYSIILFVIPIITNIISIRKNISTE